MLPYVFSINPFCFSYLQLHPPTSLYWIPVEPNHSILWDLTEAISCSTVVLMPLQNSQDHSINWMSRFTLNDLWRLFSCDVVLMILQSPNLIFLLMEEQNPQTYPQRMLTLRERGADIRANSCFLCACDAPYIFLVSSNMVLQGMWSDVCVGKQISAVRMPGSRGGSVRGSRPACKLLLPAHLPGSRASTTSRQR